MRCRQSAILLLIGGLAGTIAKAADEDWEQAARLAIGNGHYGEAAALYESAIQRKPQSGALQFQLGLARYQNGQYALATTAFKKALSLGLENLPCHAFLGLSEAAMGEPSKALPELEKAFHPEKLEPELLRLTGIQLARTYENQNRPLDAQIVYATLQRSFPTDSEILYSAFWLNLSQGKKIISQLVRSEPDSWRTHQLLGLLLLEKESYDAAAQQFRAALQSNPRAPGLNRSLADALLGGHMDDVAVRAGARTLYQTELEINPKDGATLRQLAELSMKEAKPDEAKTFLARAVAAEPGSAANFLGLCRLASSLNRNDEAWTYCEKAVAADPDNAQAHYRLAQICRTVGKREEAERELAMFQSLSARNRSESQYMTGVQIGNAPNN